MMVASNIKKMSRLELLYTCVANLVKHVSKQEDPNLPESLKHYTKESDHNEVLYHHRSEDTDSKIKQVLSDADLIEAACGSRYDESSEYQLLIRVIREQTERTANGERTLKKTSSDMDSTILQNPADPDATFCKKAGTEHRGYIANVVELANAGQSITVDYQFEQNIYSDSRFMKDYIDQQLETEDTTIIVTDGGYYGNENAKSAARKNIRLITTDLKGMEANDLWADFEFSEDGTELTKCAGGNTPKTSVYDKNTQRCKASFPIHVCQSCAHFRECQPQLHKRVATIKLAQRTSYHAKQQRYIKTDESKAFARYRNGVETVPAALRKRHHVDTMPVRGRIKCKLFFGFKVAAMNVRKLVRYMSSQSMCAPNPQMT